MRKLGTYKAADLTCQPIDISLENFGKTPPKSCQYFVTFKNGKFVVMNNGKPIIGKIVGQGGDLVGASTVVDDHDDGGTGAGRARRRPEGRTDWTTARVTQSRSEFLRRGHRT